MLAATLEQSLSIAFLGVSKTSVLVVLAKRLPFGMLGEHTSCHCLLAYSVSGACEFYGIYSIAHLPNTLISDVQTITENSTSLHRYKLCTKI